MQHRGFTLVEILVAVALFSVVMTVSVAALLSLVTANRKTQALQSVMSNLNTSLDSIVRATRTGSAYHCGSGDIQTTRSCPGGDTLFAFRPYCNGPSCDPTDRWEYQYDASRTICGADICKTEYGDSTVGPYAITAPEVTIEHLRFYVIGTDKNDSIQPKVLIELKGTAGGTSLRTRSDFTIQAVAAQRILDL